MVIRYRELRKKSKGFTLIELMIVIAIIAILAAIAIPQYRKFQLKAKTAEGKTNIGAIRTAEEAYAAEKDNYVFCGWTPGAAPEANGNNWETGAGHAGFESIGFQPSGKVRFTYVVAAAANGTPTDAQENQVNDGNADIYITAKSNLDGDTSGHKNGWWYATDEDPNIVYDNRDY